MGVKGSRSVSLLPERDKGLLEREVCEERAEAKDEVGEGDRGDETASEQSAAWGRVAIGGGVKEDREGEDEGDAAVQDNMAERGLGQWGEAVVETEGRWPQLASRRETRDGRLINNVGDGPWRRGRGGARGWRQTERVWRRMATGV